MRAYERNRARDYFDAARSGDTLLFLKPQIKPIVETSHYVATHGSPWDYDRRVPVAFWRRGMTPAASEEVVETTDILPTLSAMIGLPLGAPAIDGHCIQTVPGVTCPSR